MPGQDWKAIWQNGLARAGFLMLILFVTAAFLKSQGRRRVILTGLLLIVFWLDFVKHVPNQNPTVAPSVYAPGWASAQAKWQGAAPRPGGSRVMIAPLAQKVMWSETYLWNRLGFFEDCNLLENVPQVYGLFSLTPRPALQATLLPYMRADRNFPGLLDFLAVSQITAPGKNSDWVPRPTAMPFVTAGQQPMFADGTAAFDAFYQTNLDLRKIVFLPPEARVEISAVRQPEARAEVAEFADERIWIRAESPVACLVVLSQTYYPAWKAFLDGRAVKIWRANYAFQAVQVPAGSHQLQLRYEDRPFQVGLVLSGLGLMCCLSLWLVAHWRKMRLQTLVRARHDQGPEAFSTELLFPSRRHQASAGAMLQL